MASPTLTNSQFLYVKVPEGEVTAEHYKLVENIPIPELQNGEVLVKAKYISVDPYMRIQQSRKDTWEAPYPLNKVQAAGVTGEVIDSKDPNVPKGTLVNCYAGWQKYSICKGSDVRKLLVSDVAKLSYSIGILGMPGRTAYFGLLDIGKPKEGETVVVSGAAGAVGLIVVGIAKIKGCRVVAIAGSDEKCGLLTKEFGADAAINYKKHPTAKEMYEALKAACPSGIDIYFDNVGGPATDAVFELINLRSRTIICGQISQYNGGLDNPSLGPRFLHKLIYTRSLIQGVLARDYTSRNPEMLEQMTKWLEEKKIKYHETITEGFENLPKALNSLFHGHNTGKMIVKVD